MTNRFFLILCIIQLKGKFLIVELKIRFFCRLNEFRTTKEVRTFFLIVHINIRNIRHIFCQIFKCLFNLKILFFYFQTTFLKLNVSAQIKSDSDCVKYRLELSQKSAPNLKFYCDFLYE